MHVERRAEHLDDWQSFPAPDHTAFQNRRRDRYPRLAQRHHFDPHRHEDLSHAFGVKQSFARGMGGIPNRTSFELHLPAELSARYSPVMGPSVGGRLAARIYHGSVVSWPGHEAGTVALVALAPVDQRSSQFGNDR